MQREGIDFDKTFAPTPSMEMTRLLAAMRTERNMGALQIDFSGAFVNSYVNKIIHMKQPKGMEIKGMEGKVIRLIKALYGLKQSNMLWSEDLDKLMVEECGFTRCPFEPCTYMRTYSENRMIVAEFHTDDGKIYNDRGLEEEARRILGIIGSRYKITIKENVDVFLGVKIDYNDTKTTLDQHAYLKTILDDFQETTEEFTTPWDTGVDAEFDIVRNPTKDDTDFMKGREYFSLVGKLQYLVHTRPDIAYHVGKLARFSVRPRKVHWQAGQRVLGYLRRTFDYKLTYTRGEAAGKAGIDGDPMAMEAYSDADFGGDKETRKSTSGVVVKCCGGVVVASSKRQTTVAD
jgi:hypothetical protein